MDSGVKADAVDLPEANDITVGIIALVAQHKPARGDSRRTKGRSRLPGAAACGLATRTVRQPCAALERGAPFRVAIARNADRHARDLAPVVADVRTAGITGLDGIADELNARGMLTPRVGRWHKSTVMNLLDRLGLREAACASPG
jgi:hypothetical protein